MINDTEGEAEEMRQTRGAYHISRAVALLGSLLEARGEMAAESRRVEVRQVVGHITMARALRTG
jgi:hypothetical protein